MAAGSSACSVVGDTTADMDPKLLYPSGTASSASSSPIVEGDRGMVPGESGSDSVAPATGSTCAEFWASTKEAELVTTAGAAIGGR